VRHKAIVPKGITSHVLESCYQSISTILGSWIDATMSKETQRSPDRLDWDIRAADALELAREMPPGQERSEALKLASLLRCTADARGLIFAKWGRPRR
jgi:hypothetical protein